MRNSLRRPIHTHTCINSSNLPERPVAITFSLFLVIAHSNSSLVFLFLLLIAWRIQEQQKVQDISCSFWRFYLLKQIYQERKEISFGIRKQMCVRALDYSIRLICFVNRRISTQTNFLWNIDERSKSSLWIIEKWNQFRLSSSSLNRPLHFSFASITFNRKVNI